MKLTLLIIALIVTVPAIGQITGRDCDLADAKTFYVTHSATTPLSERKKIDKALRRPGGMKQVDRVDRADIEIDFTEPDWLNVWRPLNGTRSLFGRWSLVEGSASMTLPGSIQTTTTRAGRTAMSRTTVAPPRRVTVHVSPKINSAGEFMFQLKVRRQQCRVRLT